MNLKKSVYWQRDSPGVIVKKYWVWQVWDEDADTGNLGEGIRVTEELAHQAADEFIAKKLAQPQGK